ncbi:MAG: phosphoribosylglycinamide formyltransferase [Syntrophobacteraceae bacterium]|nr:phosphoribosylglycinamide formyltransferase [Syntrophobacteraceae bacterium]
MIASKHRLRVAVLLSGSGTNLQAMIDAAGRGTLAGSVVVVASDRPDAQGLGRARNAGIPAHMVDYRSYMRLEVGDDLGRGLPVDIEELDRSQRILKNPDPRRRLEQLHRLVLAEQELIRVLDAYQPDCICLAGFMRLVSPYLIGHYNRQGSWKIINIHPALLPAFPGQHGYRDTFAYGCKWGGITIHFVDEGEDSGPVIAQAVYPIWPDDDLEAVNRRGLRMEHEMYVQVINWLAADHIRVEGTESGRLRTVNTDPDYRGIIESWIAKAFED